MKKCRISKIETLGLVDGPGIRTIFFFQGCPLRCLYCHNPETWDIFKGNEYEVEELVRIAKKYKNYYGSNGGVTISGGEPLLQSESLMELLKRLKEEDIHTCIDTSGFGNKNINEILTYVDLVIYDIKHLNNEECIKLTSQKNDIPMTFLNTCITQNKDLWVRQVIIPGINDNQKYIDELISFLKNVPNIKNIELIPYQDIGIQKYVDLKIEYPLKEIKNMDKNKCLEWTEYINNKIKENT